MGTAAGNQDSNSIFFSQAPSSRKEEKKHILPKYHDDEDVVLDEEETTTFLTGENKGGVDKQNGKKRKEVQASFWFADDAGKLNIFFWLEQVAVILVAFGLGWLASNFYAKRQSVELNEYSIGQLSEYSIGQLSVYSIGHDDTSGL